MSSKFINTKYQDTLNNIVEGSKERLNSPYNLYNDTKGTKVTYYNKSINLSSTDSQTGQVYTDVGNKSPFKFNKIYNMIIYGLPKIEVDLNNNEWGVESDSIEGSAIILPNTIIPTPDDFFMIDYVKGTLLFKVTKSTNDTLDNNNNFYKIEYKLDKLSNEDVEKQVQEEYTMMIENSGTNYNTIVRKKDYNLLKRIEEVNCLLVDYYKNLFYSPRVQTFILNNHNVLFYDSYLIEFLIRNKIMYTNDEDYLFIDHQIQVPQTFIIEYNKSFFRYIEKLDNIDKYYISSQAECIDEPFSLLNTRTEKYFKIIYRNNNEMQNTDVCPIINNFDFDLIEKIKENKYYNDDKLLYRNIIIRYINSDNFDIVADDFNKIDLIQLNNTKQLFYEIPILIFIIDKYIKRIMSTTYH